MDEKNEPDFSNCVYCQTEPRKYKLDDGRTMVECACGRLSIASNDIDLTAALWNAANPWNISHATAFSDNAKVFMWNHGGDPDVEEGNESNDEKQEATK